VSPIPSVIRASHSAAQDCSPFRHAAPADVALWVDAPAFSGTIPTPELGGRGSVLSIT
jgi:hypothetical protein